MAAAELTNEDIVLEVGPGPGMLTHLLLQQAKQVIAVELDPGMATLLRHEYGANPNLTVVQADILKTNLAELVPSANVTKNAYKVVANLPYYITSAVMRHLLEATPQPERLVVMVQKEVAQRMVAQPGQMSILAVSIQFYGQPILVHHVPAGAFYPVPKVDSTVVRIDCYTESPYVGIKTDSFFRVVKAGFSQKRKQLKNTLAAGLHRPKMEMTEVLEAANIDPKRRAESLSVPEWVTLVKALGH